MKLILRQAVENLGSPGDIVDVKPGFARNYLIPQGLAYEASQANVRRLEEEKAQAEAWYRRLWAFSDRCLVDHDNGGWFPEIDIEGRPSENQFIGKPDIYHSVQAALFPLGSGLSRIAEGLPKI